MNWIILIIAGLCEVGFTYCLGRAKSVVGLEWWLWIVGLKLLHYAFFLIITLVFYVLVLNYSRSNKVAARLSAA